MSNLTASNGDASGRAQEVAGTAVSPKVRPARRKWPRFWFLALAALITVGLAVVLTADAVNRVRQEQMGIERATERSSARPRVTVVEAHSMASEVEQVFPGSPRPLLEAGLYPRVTGYIKTRLVDIGDRVKEGQVLAVIAAPDLDDQLARARANLTQARANLEKAKADAELSASAEKREKILLSGGQLSEVDYAVKFKTSGADKAAVTVTEAAIKVNEAEVRRLTDQQVFEKIVAPFAGVITGRRINPGDLVSSDSTDRELFHLMQTDTLRVFVDVPQLFATEIRVGQRAVVYRPEDPLKPISGKVTRTADALDSSTRSLRAELQVANPDNALRPGMDLRVKFVFRNEQKAILIPGAAVVMLAGAPRVAVMDEQHRVKYRSVQLGRNQGAEVEVLAGLAARESIVLHPGDDLADGTVVDPVHQQPVGR